MVNSGLPLQASRFNSSRMRHLILILFFFVEWLTAQPYFSLAVDFEDGNETGDAILELDDGSVLVGSNSLCTELGLVTCSQLVRMESNGEIIWKNTYDSWPVSNLLNRHSLIQKGPFILMPGWFWNGWVNDEGEGESDTEQDWWLRMITLDGELLPNEQKIFSITPNNDQSRTMIESQHGGYVWVGTVNNWVGEVGDYEALRREDAFIMKLDDDFNVEWHTRIETEDITQEAITITNDQDGGYILGGRENEWFDELEPRQLMWKLDSAGNVLWRKDFETFEGGVPGQSTGLNVTTYKEGYAIAGRINDLWDGKNALAPTHTYISRLDGNGEEMWQHIFIDKDNFLSGKYITKIMANSREEIIWCGYDSNDMEFGNEDINRFAWIGCMSAEGEVKWERKFYQNNTSVIGPTLYDIIETSDGSLMATGNINDTKGSTEWGQFPLALWVIKVDSNGCLEPGCTEKYIDIYDITTTVTDFTPPEKKIKAYPNPLSSSQLHFEGLKSGVSYSIRLYNLSGRELLKRELTSGEELDIPAHLSNGLYFIEFLGDEGSSLVKVQILR